MRPLEPSDVRAAAGVLATAGGIWIRLAFGRNPAQQVATLLGGGLVDPRVVTLVAERAGHLVGIVRLMRAGPRDVKHSPESTLRARTIQALLGRGPVRAREVYIESLAVSPSARGAGIGRALLDAAVAVARDERAIELTCWVHRGNVPALTLCRQIGLHRGGAKHHQAPIALLFGMRALGMSVVDIRPGG